MPFEFTTPDTIEEALELHSDGALWFAGGTDIIPEFKTGLAEPTRLVNLKRIATLRGIEFTGEGLRLGALTTLAEIAEDTHVQKSYRALAQACELSATPQIRNVATIGGNICQDSRCPYYRGEFLCYLKGGDSCFARDGENRGGAVIGYQNCVHTHPSDPANALIAFDAEVLVRGRGGEMIVPAGDFFKAPKEDNRRMNVLERDQLICELRLPQVAKGTRSIFIKSMDRATWAFALVSAAVRLDLNEGQVTDARVVLGGVAPTPWRDARVEQILRGADLTDDLAWRASAEVLGDSTPLSHNRYKLRLSRALVRRALVELTQIPRGGS